MAFQQERDADPGFAVVRNGFDRSQVKEYVRTAEAAAERSEAQVREARAEVAELSGQLELARREIDALTERLDKIGTAAAAASAPNAGERAARAVVVAKAQANEVNARAQAAAETAWTAAEEASTALRDRYRRLLADLDTQHNELHGAHKRVMDEARAKVTAMTKVADQRQKDIDDRAERERQRLEQQFQEQQAERRAALAEEIESNRAAAEREAARLVQEATDEADKRIAAATSVVERLTALREQLATRLRGTNDLLTRSVSLLEPLEAEAEFTAETPADLADLPPVKRPAPSTP
ncbi:putative cellulose-binding protein [Actinokineospora spheciospongiae]|uniref:Putative cellulose-binding protein n=1 Tax=Actinokineospora spheciospongiae TaxID=909613 RepID=W7IRU2_9PSEU|nr:hypothetical protein [Actinokineospora spheciospongiae]EWC59181.1 putative cellulose-binding protein [Actinokineospora spheciospongiae]